MQVRPMAVAPVLFQGAKAGKEIPVTGGVKALAPRESHEFILELVHREPRGNASPGTREQWIKRQKGAFEARMADFQTRLDDWMRRENINGAIKIEDSAWINDTVKVRSDRETMEKLAKAAEFQDDLQLIDVPGQLVRE